jgi:hypothetical protein
MAEAMMKNTTETIGIQQFKEHFLQQHKLKQAQRGVSSMSTSIIPHQRTVRNYFRLFQSMDQVKTLHKTTSKTPTRVVAEQSLMSCVCMAMVTAVTSFIVEPCTTATHQYVTTASSIPRGRRPTMAEMISMFHDGAPIAAILPSMTLSTDDCTLFIFEGTNGGSSEVRVGSSSESGSVNGLWRLVRHGLNGFRIRSTTTLSAGGFAAPQYWTVTGLSEEEFIRLPSSISCAGSRPCWQRR